MVAEQQQHGRVYIRLVHTCFGPNVPYGHGNFGVFYARYHNHTFSHDLTPSLAGFAFLEAGSVLSQPGLIAY